MWGGSSITPGSEQEILSLRTEHGGVVGVLLVLYDIQIYMGTRINPAEYKVKTWIDNAEVLARGGTKVHESLTEFPPTFVPPLARTSALSIHILTL